MNENKKVNQLYEHGLIRKVFALHDPIDLADLKNSWYIKNQEKKSINLLDLIPIGILLSLYNFGRILIIFILSKN